MTFQNQDDIIKLIQANQEACKRIQSLRYDSQELYALKEGDGFKELLIDKIEYESGESAIARKKYSRNVTDLIKRVRQPLSAIFYATGENIMTSNVNDNSLSELRNRLSSVTDNKSVSKYIQDVAIEVRDVDPAGCILIEYKSTVEEEDSRIYPSYKSIHSIRDYKTRGQEYEYILFEPTQYTIDENRTLLVYRLIDDLVDYTIIQEPQNGDEQGRIYIYDESNLNEVFARLGIVPTFDHPFGIVPALTCSELNKINDVDYKISPLYYVVDLIKEYARDTSVKTIYKFLQGFPKHWKYVDECRECNGSGQSYNQELNRDTTCSTCQGNGTSDKSGVTTELRIGKPTGDNPVLTTFAGFITPDLAYLQSATSEIEMLERVIYKTFWGTIAGFEDINGVRSATEIVYNNQPRENELNRSTDYIEYVENRISNWILNWIDRVKERNDHPYVVNKGRRYVLESSESILKSYEDSRIAGSNTVILDRLFLEYLTSKFRNNPTDLTVNIKKMNLEPYLHLSMKEVSQFFGVEEATRKASFNDFWLNLDEQLKINLNEEAIKQLFTNQLNINNNGSSEEN